MNNILLVDDNKYIIEALAMTLGQYVKDCAVLRAKNGREAVDILKSVPVDLVLTDINMPVMNGYDLIAYRNDRHPALPLVAMTADPAPGVLKRLRALGISECLEKPFDFDSVSRLLLDKLPPRRYAPTTAMTEALSATA
jgi:CheY-like chemotaxis protein